MIPLCKYPKKMGRFNKKTVKFNKKLLKSLKNTINSGVEVCNVTQHLAIHPCQLKDFNQSVKDLLNEKLIKYNNECNGIILGYENIKLLQDGGYIHDDSCYIHFDIQADFFVFKPEIGKIMKGVVARKSKDHIAVLVYQAFNVSIPMFDEDMDQSLFESVKVGDEVSFQILFIDMSSYLPYIRGKLMSTGIKSEENSNEESQEIIHTEPVKKKKKKKKDIKVEKIDEDS